MIKVVAGLIISLLIFAPGAATGTDEELLELKVKGVAADPSTNTPVVVLEDPSSLNILPIWIGTPEAQAIALELEHVMTPRPMTHDLLKSVLEKLNARVEKVIISDLRENTYYAKIILDTNGSEIEIDSRPSDAIALAVRTKSPIYVAKRVMEESGRLETGERTTDREVGERYGLYVQRLTEELAEHFDALGITGVLVSDVKEGSPAQKAGLRQGDIILRAGGSEMKEPSDLMGLLLDLKEGGKVSMEITRKRRNISLDLNSP